MPTTSEKLIHVRFDYDEAVQSKRDILASEANLLRIIKKIKQYQLIRAVELKLKIRLNRKTKEFLALINKIRQTVPKIKIPEILKKEEFGGVEESEKGNRTYKNLAKEDAYSRDIESQLREIQEKLKSLK